MCEIIDYNKKKELINILVENLPVFRAKLGATQDTFAQRVGLTKTTLNHIENHKKNLLGVISLPSSFSLCRMKILNLWLK